jgi:hypothetical protein
MSMQAKALAPQRSSFRYSPAKQVPKAHVEPTAGLAGCPLDQAQFPSLEP